MCIRDRCQERLHDRRQADLHRRGDPRGQDLHRDRDGQPQRQLASHRGPAGLGVRAWHPGHPDRPAGRAGKRDEARADLGIGCRLERRRHACSARRRSPRLANLAPAASAPAVDRCGWSAQRHGVGGRLCGAQHRQQTELNQTRSRLRLGLTRPEPEASGRAALTLLLDDAPIHGKQTCFVHPTSTGAQLRTVGASGVDAQCSGCIDGGGSVRPPAFRAATPSPSPVSALGETQRLVRPRSDRMPRSRAPAATAPAAPRTAPAANAVASADRVPNVGIDTPRAAVADGLATVAAPCACACCCWP